MTREKNTRKDTRNLLMMTAGRLFAEHGYDKVSTRKIADTAQVNLGGIHYHFGSKEKLYIEAFKYAINKSKASRFGEAAIEFPDLMHTPEGQAEIIRTVVERIFQNLYQSQETAWVHQLILRELYFPSSAETTLLTQVFMPTLEESLTFFDRIKSGLTQGDKLYFAVYPGSNALFYFTTIRPFGKMYGQAFDREDYLKKAQHLLTVSLLQMLELPVSDSLQL